MFSVNDLQRYAFCSAIVLATSACGSPLIHQTRLLPETHRQAATTETSRVVANVRELPGTGCTVDVENRSAFFNTGAQFGTPRSASGVSQSWPLAQYSEPGAERFDWSVTAMYLPARANETNVERLSRALALWDAETNVHPQSPSLAIVSPNSRVWTFARDASWTTKLRLELVGSYVVAVDANYGPSGEPASARFVESLHCTARTEAAPLFAPRNLSSIPLELEMPTVMQEAPAPSPPARSEVEQVPTITWVGPVTDAFEGAAGRVRFQATLRDFRHVASIDATAGLSEFAHREFGGDAQLRTGCALYGRAKLTGAIPVLFDPSGASPSSSFNTFFSFIESGAKLIVLRVSVPSDMTMDEWMSAAYFLYQPHSVEHDFLMQESDLALAIRTGTVIDAPTMGAALRASHGRLPACFRTTGESPVAYTFAVNRGGSVVALAQGADAAHLASVDSCAAPLIRALHFPEAFTARVGYLQCTYRGCDSSPAYEQSATSIPGCE